MQVQPRLSSPSAAARTLMTNDDLARGESAKILQPLHVSFTQYAPAIINCLVHSSLIVINCQSHIVFVARALNDF